MKTHRDAKANLSCWRIAAAVGWLLLFGLLSLMP